MITLEGPLMFRAWTLEEMKLAGRIGAAVPPKYDTKRAGVGMREEGLRVKTRNRRARTNQSNAHACATKTLSRGYVM
jgi:hypothetical protein